MGELKLFTDGSVAAQSNIGYGAYLVVSEHGLSLDTLRSLMKQIKANRRTAEYRISNPPPADKCRSVESLSEA